MTTYPTEVLDPDEDNGTMPANVNELSEAVVGHRIVSVEHNANLGLEDWRHADGTVITLDDGTRELTRSALDQQLCLGVAAFGMRGCGP